MRFLVIGDSCTDIFIYGVVTRLCPDAPVPILIPTHEIKNGGMASNVYNNIVSLGYDADIITNTNVVTKTRYVEKSTNQMIMRLDSYTNKSEKINNIESIKFSQYECIIVSDYNKGFLEYNDIEYICNNHDKVFIDTKKIIKDKFKNAFCIKINETEYNNNMIAGYDVKKSHKNVIVTLGNRGCEFKKKIFSVKNVEIKDMSGAGDTFISGLVTSYAETNNFDKAIKFANQCATQVVQKKGVSIVNRNELN